MEHANVGGIDLEFQVRGSGDPVLLIHASVIADGFAPLLAEASFAQSGRIIQYHRRGFAGSTRHTGPRSVAQQASDCRGLLRYLDVSRAHVLGHSYGGSIALQLALEAPDTVHSLCLLEPALMFVPGAAQFMQQMTPIVQMYDAGQKVGAIDAFLRLVSGPHYREALDRLLPGEFELAVVDADTLFQVELPSLQGWSFRRDDARRIWQPVLSAVGSDSEPIFSEIHQMLLTWFPQVETLIVPAATHTLQMMNPIAVADGLAHFFKRHPVGAERSAAEV